MQLTEAGAAPSVVDVEGLACGALIMCRIDPAGDTDAFTFVAPMDGAASIKIAGVPGSLWALFSPSGSFIRSSFGQAESGPLPSTGTYTIKTSNTANSVGGYTLSLQQVGGP